MMKQKQQTQQQQQNVYNKFWIRIFVFATRLFRMRTLQFSSNSFVNGKHIIIEQSRRKNSISSRRHFHFSIAPLLLDTPNVSASTPRWRVTARSSCFCFRSLFSFSILLFIIVRANALPRMIWNQHTHATQLRQIYLPITHKLRTSYSEVTRVSLFFHFFFVWLYFAGVLECWCSIVRFMRYAIVMMKTAEQKGNVGEHRIAVCSHVDGTFV